MYTYQAEVLAIAANTNNVSFRVWQLDAGNRVNIPGGGTLELPMFRRMAGLPSNVAVEPKQKYNMTLAKAP